MGPQDNVAQLSFNFDALAPVTPQAATLDPTTGQSSPVSQPDPLGSQLSKQPARSLRTAALDNTAGLNPTQAGLRMQEVVEGSVDAASASGVLDTIRYGAVLRARHTVEVRGAGNSQDGEYYVSQVTHNIRRGEYKQKFQLKRGGQGAASPRVRGTG
jgi:hypothetical protein